MEFRIRAGDVMDIRADDVMEFRFKADYVMEFLTNGIIHATLKKNNQDKRVVKYSCNILKRQ